MAGASRPTSKRLQVPVYFSYASSRDARRLERKQDSIRSALLAGGYARLRCGHLRGRAARPLAGAALRVGPQRLGLSGPSAQLCRRLLPVPPRRQLQDLRLPAGRRAGRFYQRRHADRHFHLDRHRGHPPALGARRRAAPADDDRGRRRRGDERRDRGSSVARGSRRKPALGLSAHGRRHALDGRRHRRRRGHSRSPATTGSTRFSR